MSPFRITLLSILALAPAAAGAGPADDLLRLAPPDANFVLLVRDLRTQTATVWDGPFAQSVRASKLGRSLEALPELAQLASVRQQLEAAIGIGWPQVRDELLGDAVLFAYKSGPPGQPELEQGVLMTWARNQKLADELFQRLEKVQRASGELREIQPLVHRGVDYVKRVKTKGPAEFVLRRGPVVVMSAQETVIHEVIARDRQADGSLARQFDRLQARGVATLWLKPRSFDAELAEKLRLAAGEEKAFLTTFSRCWRALEGTALTIGLDRHIELNLTAAIDKDRFPPSLLKLASAFNERSALSAAFPSDDIFQVTGRLQLPTFLEALASFMTPNAWQALTTSFESGVSPVLGKKYLGQLIEQLGPDWGICVSAPASSKSLLPDIVAAVRIKPSADGKLERALMDGCDSLATLARLKLSAGADEPVRLETQLDKLGEIKYLSHEKVFLPGLRPAYALRAGFLVIASSPEAILRLDLTRKPAANEPNRLMVFSPRELGRYVTARRQQLIQSLNDGQQDIVKQLDQLVMLAEIFDRFELINESATAGQLKLSFKLIPLQPLKK